MPFPVIAAAHPAIRHGARCAIHVCRTSLTTMVENPLINHATPILGAVHRAPPMLRDRAADLVLLTPGWFRGMDNCAKRKRVRLLICACSAAIYSSQLPLITEEQNEGSKADHPTMKGALPSNENHTNKFFTDAEKNRKGLRLKLFIPQTFQYLCIICPTTSHFNPHFKVDFSIE